MGCTHKACFIYVEMSSCIYLTGSMTLHVYFYWVMVMVYTFADSQHNIQASIGWGRKIMETSQLQRM